MIQNLLFDSVRFFRKHYIPIAMIILPIFIPIEIFDAIYSNYVLKEDSGLLEQLPIMFIGLLVSPIYTAGVIFYISSAVAGDAIDTKSCWRFGIKYWMPLFILNVFVGTVITLGFLLLVIPGIILLARYAFAEFELLLNNSRPLDAMKSSWETTRKFVWIILGGYLVITIVLVAPYYILDSALEHLEIELGILGNFLNIIYSVLGVIYTIFTFRVYHLAKEEHKNGLNPTAEITGV